jgi:dipeptidase
MRDHFEGTDLDMTKDAGAGSYKVPYRWRPMTFKVDGQEYTNERAIATQQTGFVIVPQMRNWLPDAIGGILWFGVDDAGCVHSAVLFYHGIARVLPGRKRRHHEFLVDFCILDSQLGGQPGLR